MKLPYSASDKPELIIYCQKWCEYMHHLVNLLQEYGWPFTFVDLRFNHEIGHELVAQFGKPLSVPVVKIGGEYYVKPALSEVPVLLNAKEVEYAQYG